MFGELHPFVRLVFDSCFCQRFDFVQYLNSFEQFSIL